MTLGPRQTGAAANSYYGNLAVLQWLLVIGAAGLLAIGGVTFESTGHALGSYTPWLVVAIMAMGALAHEFLRRILLIDQRWLSALMADAVAYGTRVAAVIVLLLAGEQRLSWVMAIVAAGFALGGLVGRVHSRAILKPMDGERLELTSVMQKNWTMGKWLLGAKLAYWCSAQLVIYVAGAVLPLQEVGAIAAAMTLTGVVNILYLALEAYLPTETARRAESSGNETLRGYVTTVTIIGAIATAAPLLGCVIFSNEIVGLVFGNQYVEYRWVVAWIAAYQFLGFFQRPLSAALRTVGRAHWLFVAMLTGSGLAIVFGFSIVSSFGLVGALSLLCVIQASITLVMAFGWKRELGYEREEAARSARGS
jgi:O-antigen/teichoic acid export membrane protein